MDTQSPPDANIRQAVMNEFGYFCGIVVGVVAPPGTVDDGTVVLCGTVEGVVVVPGMVLLGTLLLLGNVLCCNEPGVVVLGTALGSVGVTGTVVDGTVVLFGTVVLLGTVVLEGTVLCGTVEGWTVLPGTVVDDG